MASQALTESGGDVLTVTDAEILRARELLARKEGIFAEPAGAAPLAAILRYPERFERRSTVVCPVTGNGLKTPHTGVKGKPRTISV